MKKKNVTVVVEALTISERKKMSLHVDGYEVIRGAFTITEEQREAIIERGKRGKFIFNHNKQLGVREDRKRKQISLGKKTAPEFKAAIEYMLHQRYPKLKPTNMVVLHSKAGCQRQNPHCDYEQLDDSFGTTQDELIPLGCVIAVMDGSTLEVWPRSMRVRDGEASGEPIQRVTLQLQAGDMLVFRGDLTHAGSAYTEDNYRLHTYLDSSVIERNPNRTWPMDRCPTIQA